MPRRKASASNATSGAAAKSPRGQSRDAQLKLIEIALDLIESLYVHLPLKRSMYAVNPLQRLKLLRRQAQLQTPPLSERDFFNELLPIFCQLRDLHTNVELPEPFRSSTAFLPFRLERCFAPRGEEMFLVTHVMAEEARQAQIDPEFQPGSIVTHWNGTPIHRAVVANAEREAGSNPAARFAQGLSALTIRWLGQSLLPDEEWVDIVFLPQPGTAPKQIRFQWNVFQRQASDGEAATAIARARGRNISAVGMDARAESERQIRRFLFGKGRRQEPRVTRVGEREERVASWAEEVFPICGNVTTSAGVFGYVRIRTFNVDDEQRYIGEFIRLISNLSQDGLIIDVRGNGGGLITFGERLLQLLTPRLIEPARFSFLSSTRTQDLTTRHAFIQQWRDSISQSTETGAEYSQGFPLEPLERYNDIGQKYQGPVVLVTDALCYSTTDIFSAGFQDHRIGVVLGVDETTGAGGANVWDYALIAELIGDAKRFPLVLPEQASFRFAIRRVTRVAANSGVLLEDLGVKADQLHRLTRRDLLERNVDLIERAGKILGRSEVQRLVVESSAQGSLTVQFQNLDRIDVYIDGRPLQGSVLVKRSAAMQSVSIALDAKTRKAAEQIRLEGFRVKGKRSELVAAARLHLR